MRQLVPRFKNEWKVQAHSTRRVMQNDGERRLPLMWKIIPVTSLLILLLFTSIGAPTYSQQPKSKTQHKLPELTPRRPECGLVLPARDERHDLARLVRSQQFLDCERDGFPKDLAPPWKTTDEGENKLSDACEYFAGESAKDYPQVGQENLKLAADRCHIELMQIILMKMVEGLGPRQKQP